MVVRIARILSAGVMVALLANIQPTVCSAWSLSNPFASSAKSEKKTHITKVAKQEPSMLEKLGAGMKNFFDRTGETLGLKKPSPKKYDYAIPQSPHFNAKKQTASKSWLPSMFPSEEPSKPKSVPEWMGQPRQDL